MKKLFLLLMALPTLSFAGVHIMQNDSYINIGSGTFTSGINTSTAQITSLGGGGVLCVHTDNSGNLSAASQDCGTGGGGGGGGSASIAFTTGSLVGYTKLISSPTAVVIFDSQTTRGTLLQSNTYFFSLSPDSVTLEGNAYSLAGLAASTTTIQTQFNGVGLSTTSIASSTQTLQTEMNNVAISTNAIATSTAALQVEVGNIAVSTNAIASSTAAIQMEIGNIATSTNSIASSTASLQTQLISVGISTMAVATDTTTLETQITTKINLSSITATQPILYNNTTGNISATQIALSTGVTGILYGPNMMSTVAYVTAAQTFSGTNQFTSSMTVSGSTFSVDNFGWFVSSGGFYVNPNPPVINGFYTTVSTNSVLLASAPLALGSFGISATTISLRSVASSLGQILSIYKVDKTTNPIYIQTAAGDVIAGTAAVSLYSYGSWCNIQAIGANLWEPVGQGCQTAPDNIVPQTSANTVSGVNASSDVIMEQFYNTTPCTIIGYKFPEGAVGSGAKNKFDIGVYDLNGNLLDHLGATSEGTSSTVLISTRTSPLYTLAAGTNYYAAFTLSSSVTSTFGGGFENQGGSPGVLKFTQSGVSGLGSSFTISSGANQVAAKVIPTLSIMCAGTHTNGAIN